MFGDNPFPRVFANVTPLGNEVPTYEFAYTDERSWQARYDYDFAALGVPGLTSTVRYIRGNNVDTGRGFEGKDRERDLDIGYVVQSGALKGLGVRVRNVEARSNYRSDIDENRLLLTWRCGTWPSIACSLSSPASLRRLVERRWPPCRVRPSNSRDTSEAPW